MEALESLKEWSSRMYVCELQHSVFWSDHQYVRCLVHNLI